MVKIVFDIVYDTGKRKHKFTFETDKVHKFSIESDYLGAEKNGNFFRMSSNEYQYCQNIIGNITRRSGLDEEWYAVSYDNNLLIANNIPKMTQIEVEERIRMIKQNEDYFNIITEFEILNSILMKLECYSYWIYVLIIVQRKIAELVDSGCLRGKRRSDGKLIDAIYEVI